MAGRPLFGETKYIALITLTTLVLMACAAILPSTALAQERSGASNRGGTQESMGEMDSSSRQFSAEEDGNGPTDEQYEADDVRGPLSGGRAFGLDVLVPNDVINTLPDGTRVVGIDRVVIFTRGCELRGSGDDLTITLRDQGDDFRLIDGANVDIRLEDDGRIISDGSEDFPAKGEDDNEDRIIVPIPVEESDDFEDNAPNDVYPIVSSTGIEGENCRVVGASRAPSDDPGDSDDDEALPPVGENPKDGVIPGSGPDTPLPNTGGVSPALLAAALILALGGSGLVARPLLGLRGRR